MENTFDGSTLSLANLYNNILITNVFFGFKPAKPIAIERDIREHSNKYAETKIIRRALEPNPRQVQHSFDPTKDDIGAYYRRLKLGQGYDRISRSDGSIGPRQTSNRRSSRIVQRSGKF